MRHIGWLMPITKLVLRLIDPYPIFIGLSILAIVIDMCLWIGLILVIK
jgi:hypothetical protein